MCRTLHLMQEHCKRKHDWVNGQKRGGDVRTKQLHTSNKIWTENHACQRFFMVGVWQRYFEVALPDTTADLRRQMLKIAGQEHPDRHRPTAGIKQWMAPAVDTQLNQLFHTQFHQQRAEKHDFFRAQEADIQEAERDATEDANRVHGFDDHVSAVVPWLRETAIAEHIQNLRKDEIRTAIAVPRSGDESDLRTIIDAMESLLRNAHRLCFDGPDCMLTYQCRVVLSRFQSSNVDLQGKTRPFDPYKGTKSLQTYFGTALRFVSYFSRVVAPDEYHFSAIAEDDDDTQRPEDTIEATDEQLAVWQNICQIAQRRRANAVGEDKEEGGEDGNGLKQRLLELWTLLIVMGVIACGGKLTKG